MPAWLEGSGCGQNREGGQILEPWAPGSGMCLLFFGLQDAVKEPDQKSSPLTPHAGQAAGPTLMWGAQGRGLVPRWGMGRCGLTWVTLWSDRLARGIERNRAAAEPCSAVGEWGQRRVCKGWGMLRSLRDMLIWGCHMGSGIRGWSVGAKSELLISLCTSLVCG